MYVYMLLELWKECKIIVTVLIAKGSMGICKRKVGLLHLAIHYLHIYTFMYNNILSSVKQFTGSPFQTKQQVYYK